MTDIYKVCSRCGVNQLITQYHRNLNTRDGRISACKSCIVLEKKEVRARIEYKKHKSEWTKEWYAKNYDRLRRNRLKCVYGITPEEFDALVEKQEGCCGICDKMKDLVVDHDHKTDKVRGLLCRSCNVAIGNLGDCEDGLLKALLYLRKTA